MTNTVVPGTRGAGRRARLRACAAAALALATGSARASFLSGEALDTAADIMSWVVIVIVPIIGITVFWIVHVMPEKIAHKRHHPQVQAIHTLCLLSLFFGGLLWPLAWLWAYTKPTHYRLAYGTDKAASYHLALAELHAEGKLSEQELTHLRAELDAIAARGALPLELAAVREKVGTSPRLETRAVEGTA